MTFAPAHAAVRVLDGGTGLAYESRSSIVVQFKDRAMARRCELTGKGVMSGHLVSHANNRKKRAFRPNVQTGSLASDTLGQTVALKISMNALRTVDRNGGADVFLLKAPDPALRTKAPRPKRQLPNEHA